MAGDFAKRISGRFRAIGELLEKGVAVVTFEWAADIGLDE